MKLCSDVAAVSILREAIGLSVDSLARIPPILYTCNLCSLPQQCLQQWFPRPGVGLRRRLGLQPDGLPAR